MGFGLCLSILFPALMKENFRMVAYK
jgi:hypothetical protein